MRFAALIVPLAALALSSCQTPCANTNPSTTTLNYHCADGSDL